MKRHPITILATLLALLLCGHAAATSQTTGRSGEEIVGSICVACHGFGVMGAPALGSATDWKPRVAQGREALVRHAQDGFGQMPPRGGDLTLTDLEMERAVDAILAGIVRAEPAEPIASAAPVLTARSTRAAPLPSVSAAPGQGTAKKTDQADGPRRSSGTPGAQPQPPARRASVNRFNRLMKAPSEWNPPPTEDGIHDPSSSGTALLQSPREAFAALPTSKSGNRVDWVAALERGVIAPRFDRVDPDKSAAVLDFNVAREVKGSMPDVVYPHKQHTQWLDCTNCHPSIFIPKKGANQISMASILMGQQCGVCHGKVAFPISECRKCHSQDKPPQE